MGELLYYFRLSAATFLVGLCVFGAGVFLLVSQFELVGGDGVEIVDAREPKSLIVEVSGAVNKPGVYELRSNARVEDALVTAGGFSKDVDMAWVERSINRASAVEDGAKIYIFRQSDTASAKAPLTPSFLSESSTSSTLVNINTASAKELEGLPGIGPVYAQNIIEHRPYSIVDDLLKTGAVKEHVYEGVKELISVY